MDTRLARYVFLDRDGVLNRKLPEGAYVRRWADFDWLSGAIEAIARMHRAGLTIILVTNQRGIALGLYTAEQLEVIHNKMQSQLAQHGGRIDAIYYCPHDEGVCQCRKPGTGLFEQAWQRFPQANPRNSLVIGDSLSDIQAGHRLGIKTIFIKGEADSQKPGASDAAQMADAAADSLLQAVETYLGLLTPATNGA